MVWLESQGFPERVEIVIKGADQAVSLASSPFVPPILISEISSSEREVEMEESDSGGEFRVRPACYQSAGFHTWGEGKRARLKRGGKVPAYSFIWGFLGRNPPAHQDQGGDRE